jgi:HSP20 family protein
MRYRRLSYRYALVVPAARGLPYAEPHFADLPRVRFVQTRWKPAADVCETEREIVVTVELAGIDPDALDVVLYEDAVVVEGQRRLRAAPNGRFHRAEIRQGPFRLELPLPRGVDQERVDARYDQGLLAITFPKRPANTR